eukprot:CAMPEP_0115011400 /NCGR_PEP_ID=MMETSP0216-20121206/23967_1 /TAXON_ID=223996 /ORGANISM="Protocruzia adherens, Strain Boccale" /LENGTH=283 /DNA_ID=CAMNT_0002379955 /DNA_START=1 /DNA_END=849 /DNA_ORIENTATION=-
MTPKKWLVISITFVVLSTILAASLYGSAFQMIELNEVGLKINTFTKDVDGGNVYYSGRYFVGVTEEFKTYSTKIRTIQFGPKLDSVSIRGKTRNPSEIWVDASFEFKIKEDRLYELYSEYPSDGFHSAYIDKSKHAIQEVISEVFNNDLLNYREEVAYMMAEGIRAELEKDNANLISFQLQQVALDYKLENSFIDAMVKKQEQRTLELEKQLQQNEAEINVYDSQVENQSRIKDAQAIAQAKASYYETYYNLRIPYLKAIFQGYAKLIDQGGDVAFDKGGIFW